MKEYSRIALCVLCVLCASVVPAARIEAQSLPHVVIRTSMGEIEIEVDSVHAPKTAANFLRYVDLGFYGEFGRFHRTVRADNQQGEKVKIAVIQAGLAPYKARAFPPIPLENTKVTGLRHRDGAVSMARTGPNSATSDFFICIGDQPALDYGGKRNADGQGFAAFGRVVRGTGAVKKIQEAPAKGETLTPEIPFLGAARVPR
jgi:peptidyl-prolyl cis-trans isomerase A (cyclophilin A)